jgi:hypothetical protein
MENPVQLVLAASGVVIAIALLVALAYLSAIRKSLEALVTQSRVPLQPARSEAASGHILPLEEAPPAPTPPVSRPVLVSTPPPPPTEPLRFEEAPEPVFAEPDPEIVSPPPAPAPAPAPRFEESAQRELPIEEVPKQVVATQQVPAPPPPAYSPAPVSAPPPAEPARSRMPTIIGIVVLVVAIAFLVFVVLYTK